MILAEARGRGLLTGDLRHQVNFAGAATATAANPATVKTLIENPLGAAGGSRVRAKGVRR
ncbi:MAG TPA: hypothetical protein VKE94_23400 [Gemmataceae bacterium]|nr:hypothetical protein [Gemmataceae bacterium]